MVEKEYVFVVTPSHGYLQVPKSDLIELGILSEVSGFSYDRGDFMELEEDDDAPLFCEAARRARWNVIEQTRYQDESYPLPVGERMVIDPEDDPGDWDEFPF